LSPPHSRQISIQKSGWRTRLAPLDGVESETFAGFIAVHMADDGDSAAIFRGYETLAEAERDALRVARELNAELVHRATPDEHWPDVHDHTAQLEGAGILPDLEDCE
jgi:hypothetical protein